MVSFDLTGKVAIVTGASQGLGVDFANALADYGADVVVMARRQEVLESVAADIAERTGRTIVPVRVDIGDVESINAAVAQVVERFGKVDILVNNAGSIAYGAAEDVSLEQWDREMDIDVRGVFFMAQAVFNASMKEHGGRIVNITSVGGIRASDKAPLYSIAKAAVRQMTQVLAVSWARYGVQVNSLAPGQIMVGMGENTPADRIEEFSEKVPQRRLGGHGDLDGALLYLVSDACSFTQGQDIVVDGGMTLPLA